MDTTTTTTVINGTLLDRDVYCVCFPQRDGLDCLQGELAAARKRFFSASRKKTVKVGKAEIVKGFDGKLTGKMTRHGLYWKKSAGKLNLEEAFEQKNGYSVVRRDFRGVIISRVYFDKNHLWLKSEYYEPWDSTLAKVIFKPIELYDLVERFEWDPETKRYRSTELHPLPYLSGTAEQSVVNAKYGEPGFIVSTAEGVYCYCPRKEAQKRKRALEDIKDGTIVLMPAWEVKDGALPNELPADEPLLMDEPAPETPVTEELPEEEPVVDLPPAEELTLDRPIAPTPAEEEPLPALEIDPSLNPAERIAALRASMAEKFDREKQALEARFENGSAFPEKLRERPVEPVQPEEKPAGPEQDEQTDVKTDEPVQEEAPVAEPKEGPEEAPEEAAAEEPEAQPDDETAPAEGPDTERELREQIAAEIQRAEVRTDDPETGLVPAPTMTGADLSPYRGEMLDGKREGFGAHYDRNGNLAYAGFWKDDKKNGMGVSFRDSDHALHIAKWTDGRPGGMVSLFDKDGNLRYAGQMIDGKKEGAGVSFDQEDGTIFVGKWENGRATGMGSAFDKDGNLLYYGQWKDGVRSGHGTEFDGSGSVVFDGEWRDDKYHNGILYQRQTGETEDETDGEG